ncbi:MAG: hypothetical protein HUJ65_03315, partial [Oscillospiraceae bacterium]|nr:hypothetical protein [Oscillospiraceae bacterium]
MTLGIDFTTFSEMHNGGKDQVAFNLLRGWSEAGHAKEIVCFCRGLLSEKLRDISEDFRVVDLLKLPREALEKEHIPDAILKENNVDILFFTNKGTPKAGFNLPTVAV